jgi:hypothetical protein
MKIYLIPAPDMDKRAVEAVKLEGFEVIPLNLGVIDGKMQLKQYIEILQLQIPDQNPILLGFCYGGVLALELARVINPKKVILVSSIKHHQEILWSRKCYAKIFCLLPNFLMKIIHKSTEFIFKNLIGINIKVPRIFLKPEQNKFIIRHALQFQGYLNINQVIHIHGDKDSILPLSCIRDVMIIPGGGHFMFVHKRKEVLKEIELALGE